MPQLFISEDEMIATEWRVWAANQPQPDFASRELSEYSTDDLMLLLLAVADSYERAKNVSVKSKLDVWAYRIKDAAKEASKRENAL